MNTVLLNTVSLDGGKFIIKGNGGGGGVTINNQEKSVDITENGTTEVVADAGFTGLSKVVVNTNVASSGGDTPSRPSWTGHADAEGLRAIGWTDEDIAYYQENGVNWNAEDDEYHKVSEDNKALYGVLTADNISTYKDRIVYLPKIDTSAITSFYGLFKNCHCLVSIPMLDTSNVTSMGEAFYWCVSLVSIPLLNMEKVTNISSMFNSCASLTSIPLFDTQNVTEFKSLFYGCTSLTSIPAFNTQNATSMSSMFYNCASLTSIPQLDMKKVTSANSMFYGCKSLVFVPELNTISATDLMKMFHGCYSLTTVLKVDTKNITGTKGSDIFYECRSLTTAHLTNIRYVSYIIAQSPLLSKESLLYIINNEIATASRTITLALYAYERLATDADILAALENHPNITLASA